MEKAANAERLKTPSAADPSGTAPNNQKHLPILVTEPPATQETRGTTPKGPIGSPTQDPEVLPNASEIPYNVETQEGDAANIF